MKDNVLDFNTKVSLLYEDLLKGKIDAEEANNKFKEADYKSAIEFFKEHQLSGKGQLTDDQMFGLLNIINVLQFIYNNSGIEPLVSDYDYDILYELLENGGESVVSVPITSSRMTAHHKYPNLRGSLTKVYYLTYEQKRENPSRKYLDEWIDSRENEIFNKTGRDIDLSNEDVYVFPKWDGVSGVFENDGKIIEECLTRGYTKTNEACSVYHIMKDTNLKSTIDGKHGVKVEIMMRDEDLEAYNEKYGTEYKQTRSIVSSIINSNEPDERVNYLVVQELRVEDENGNQTIAKDAFNQPYLRCKLRDREAIEKFAQKHRYVNGLRCDGAVIYIINPEIQKILGREDHKNKFEVAYKFTEEVGYSKIKSIDFQVGLFGRIAPVANIKPIKLKGNTISSISLGSYGRFKMLGLAKDDEVAIHYDIIPYLQVDDECMASGEKPIKPPKDCPICGEKLVENETGAILSCKNNKCPCRIKGKILNFIQTMGIEQLSEKRLSTLYDLGFIKSIEDLYRLKNRRDELIEIEKFGEVSVDGILAQIDGHRTQYADTILGSLGIEGIKEKTFNLILNDYDMPELMEIAVNGDINKLTSIKGIKDKKATKIIVGLYENKDLLMFLLDELNIKLREKRDTPAKFKVCFTKVRDPELEEYIKSMDGEVVSMSKKISMLIVPNTSTTGSKITTAKELGIPVVPIHDAREYIKQKYS